MGFFTDTPPANVVGAPLYDLGTTSATPSFSTGLPQLTSGGGFFDSLNSGISSLSTNALNLYKNINDTRVAIINGRAQAQSNTAIALANLADANRRASGSTIPTVATVGTGEKPPDLPSVTNWGNVGIGAVILIAAVVALKYTVK